MKKINKSKKKKLENKNILLILGLIYTLISILAVISYVSKINNISSTPVTFGSVLSSVWWQILMIVLFAVTYILYTKKTVLGALTEMIMGMAMLVYIVITVAIVGVDIFALVVELIYPLILIFHGMLEFINIRRNQKTKKSTI